LTLNWYGGIRCTENTKLKGDRTRYMDESPRWTLGDPPKYVERRPDCLNCLSEGRPGGARFIPVDVTIPSIPKTRVSTFEENWGTLQEDIKAEALGLEPGSLKKPRAPAGPRPSRAKAPAKWKSFEANVSPKQESSSLRHLRVHHTEAQGNSRRHHRRHYRRQACSRGWCWPIIGESRGRGETGDTLGKPGMLTRGGQSERPKKRRQSGVVDVDGSLRPEVH
jgi:hypothetical protein